MVLVKGEGGRGGRCLPVAATEYFYSDDTHYSRHISICYRRECFFDDDANEAQMEWVFRCSGIFEL
jgi:hypothetical protein